MSLITPTDPMKSRVVESIAYSPAAVTSPYESTVTIMSSDPSRPPGLLLQPHLEVLGLALDASPFVEELGAEGRAGGDPRKASSTESLSTASASSSYRRIEKCLPRRSAGS